MLQLPGFKDSEYPNYVWKLTKAMYSILATKFTLTNSGTPKQFIGMGVVYDKTKRELIIYQFFRYSETIVKIQNRWINSHKIVNVSKCPIGTCRREGHKYSFSLVIGGLIFLSTVSRPNISYSVQRLARSSRSFRIPHWNAGKKILAYLKGTSKSKSTTLARHPFKERRKGMKNLIFFSFGLCQLRYVVNDTESTYIYTVCTGVYQTAALSTEFIFPGLVLSRCLQLYPILLLYNVPLPLPLHHPSNRHSNTGNNFFYKET